MNLAEAVINQLYQEIIDDENHRVVAVYPGRFQPPGPHHYKTYRWLTNKFGDDNVFITMSDVTNKETSPLNFEDKKKIWIKYGIPGDKIVKVKNPYQSVEVLDLIPDGASIVFGFGKKDSDRFNIDGVKKDGTPAYLQSYEKNKNKLEDFTKHAYLIVLPHESTKLDGVELSGTEIRRILSVDKSKGTFQKIFGWYDPMIQKLLLTKFRSAPLQEVILNEGGHLFGSDPIDQKNIKSTAEAYFNEMKRLFPKKTEVFTYNQENLLGSAFKKDAPSGDIDIAFPADLFYKGKVTDWNVSDVGVKDKVKELLGRAVNYKKALKSGDEKMVQYHLMLKQQEAINILVSEYINSNSDLIVTKPKSANGNMIMTSFPQFDRDGNVVMGADGHPLLAQVDLNIGNLEWFKFSSYSADYRRNVANLSSELKTIYSSFDKLKNKSEIKGAHRTQLLLSIFEYLDLNFSHREGLKDKSSGEVLATNPVTAIKIINDKLGSRVPLTKEVVDNYHLLIKYLKDNLPGDVFEKIIDIFLKQRLESQRLDIPSDLVDYWVQNKDRLGLTGKYNTNVQGLSESGVAGGDRINKSLVKNTVEDYMENVIKPKFGDIPYKIGGSYNLGTKNDHGDIDLILNFSGMTKDEVKKELSDHISTLADDKVLPFTSKKYKGKKMYRSGEIISVLYPISGETGKAVQIDNIIATDNHEHDFKFEFLKLPAENQGLILGLVKTALVDDPELLAQVKKSHGDIAGNQEYEYNLSSDSLTLRRITYDQSKLARGEFKEIDRENIIKTSDWSQIEKILPKYKLGVDFDTLLNQVRANASDRSKRRIAGVFKSMITTKSGEQGTPKGDGKEIARKKVDSALL